MCSLDKLKQEDIKDLDVGPEIDALIAEVMGKEKVGWYAPYDRSGLHLHYKRYPTRQEAYEAYAKYWDNWLKEGNTVEDVHLCYWKDNWGPIFVDEYSTEVDVAAVATFWISKKMNICLSINIDPRGVAEVYFHDGLGASIHFRPNYALTEALARCRAVLYAVLEWRKNKENWKEYKE